MTEFSGSIFALSWRGRSRIFFLNDFVEATDEALDETLRTEELEGVGDDGLAELIIDVVYTKAIK